MDEDNRGLLELLRAIADSLQLADVPVGDAVAAAHRFGCFARAHAGLAASSDGGGVADTICHLAFHPLRALGVSEATGSPAGLSLSGGAYWTAVALVQNVPCKTVSRYGRALRLITLVRAADHMAFSDAGFA